jgi:hypothetical protein
MYAFVDKPSKQKPSVYLDDEMAHGQYCLSRLNAVNYKANRLHHCSVDCESKCLSGCFF